MGGAGLAGVLVGSFRDGLSGFRSGLVGVMSVVTSSSGTTGVEGRNVRFEIFTES